MRVQVTAAGGRNGSIPNDGVASLRCSQAKGHEAKKLLLLFQEIRDGNLGFWAPLIWAVRTGKVKAKDEERMSQIINKVQDDFELFCEGPKTRAKQSKR